MSLKKLLGGPGGGQKHRAGAALLPIEAAIAAYSNPLTSFIGDIHFNKDRRDVPDP
jgi:hypothetical protein